MKSLTDLKQNQKIAPEPKRKRRRNTKNKPIEMKKVERARVIPEFVYRNIKYYLLLPRSIFVFNSLDEAVRKIKEKIICMKSEISV